MASRSSSKSPPSAERPAGPVPAAGNAPALLPQGQHRGKPGMTLTRPFTLAGARTRAHLHLVSSTVSKCHAAIVNDNGRIYVRDLASRAHVYVNGRVIREVELADGDLLQIGSFTFKLARPAEPAALAAQAAAQLEMTGSAEALQLDGRTTVIGRRSICDLYVEHESVSTVHAMIFELDGQRFIRDLGSRTGTFVNGTAIHQQPLNFGDRIRIGPAEYQYQPSRHDAGSFDDIDELEDLVGTARMGHAEQMGFAASTELQEPHHTIAEPGIPAGDGVSTDRAGGLAEGQTYASGNGAGNGQSYQRSAEPSLPLLTDDDFDAIPLAGDEPTSPPAFVASPPPPPVYRPSVPPAIDLDAEPDLNGLADTIGLPPPPPPAPLPTLSPLIVAEPVTVPQMPAADVEEIAEVEGIAAALPETWADDLLPDDLMEESSGSEAEWHASALHEVAPEMESPFEAPATAKARPLEEEPELADFEAAAIESQTLLPPNIPPADAISTLPDPIEASDLGVSPNLVGLTPHERAVAIEDAMDVPEATSSNQPAHAEPPQAESEYAVTPYAEALPEEPSLSDELGLDFINDPAALASLSDRPAAETLPDGADVGALSLPVPSTAVTPAVSASIAGGAIAAGAIIVGEAAVAGAAAAPVKRSFWGKLFGRSKGVEAPTPVQAVPASPPVSPPEAIAAPPAPNDEVGAAAGASDFDDFDWTEPEPDAATSTGPSADEALPQADDLEALPAAELLPEEAELSPGGDDADRAEAVTTQPLGPVIGTAEMSLSGLGGQGGQIVLSGPGPVAQMWGMTPSLDLSTPMDVPVAPEFDRDNPTGNTTISAGFSPPKAPGLNPANASNLPPDDFDDLVSAPPVDAIDSESKLLRASEALDDAAGASHASTSPVQAPAMPAMTSPPASELPPAYDPFFGMGRDQGSFFGGMPLSFGPVSAGPGVPASSPAATPRASASPPRPRLPFADSPVTFDTHVETLAEVVAVDEEAMPMFGAAPADALMPAAPREPMRSDVAHGDDGMDFFGESTTPRPAPVAVAELPVAPAPSEPAVERVADLEPIDEVAELAAFAEPLSAESNLNEASAALAPMSTTMTGGMVEPFLPLVTSTFNSDWQTPAPWEPLSLEVEEPAAAEPAELNEAPTVTDEVADSSIDEQLADFPPDNLLPENNALLDGMPETPQSAAVSDEVIPFDAVAADGLPANAVTAEESAADAMAFDDLPLEPAEVADVPLDDFDFSDLDVLPDAGKLDPLLNQDSIAASPPVLEAEPTEPEVTEPEVTDSLDDLFEVDDFVPPLDELQAATPTNAQHDANAFDEFFAGLNSPLDQAGEKPETAAAVLPVFSEQAVSTIDLDELFSESEPTPVGVTSAALSAASISVDDAEGAAPVIGDSEPVAESVSEGTTTGSSEASATETDYAIEASPVAIEPIETPFQESLTADVPLSLAEELRAFADEPVDAIEEPLVAGRESNVAVEALPLEMHARSIEPVVWVPEPYASEVEQVVEAAENAGLVDLVSQDSVESEAHSFSSETLPPDDLPASHEALVESVTDEQVSLAPAPPMAEEGASTLEDPAWDFAPESAAEQVAPAEELAEPLADEMPFEQAAAQEEIDDAVPAGEATFVAEPAASDAVTEEAATNVPQALPDATELPVEISLGETEAVEVEPFVLPLFDDNLSPVTQSSMAWADDPVPAIAEVPVGTADTDAVEISLTEEYLFEPSAAAWADEAATFDLEPISTDEIDRPESAAPAAKAELENLFDLSAEMPSPSLETEITLGLAPEILSEKSSALSPEEMEASLAVEPHDLEAMAATPDVALSSGEPEADAATAMHALEPVADESSLGWTTLESEPFEPQLNASEVAPVTSPVEEAPAIAPEPTAAPTAPRPGPTRGPATSFEEMLSAELLPLEETHTPAPTASVMAPAAVANVTAGSSLSASSTAAVAGTAAAMVAGGAALAASQSGTAVKMVAVAKSVRSPSPGAKTGTPTILDAAGSSAMPQESPDAMPDVFGGGKKSSPAGRVPLQPGRPGVAGRLISGAPLAKRLDTVQTPRKAIALKPGPGLSTGAGFRPPVMSPRSLAGAAAKANVEQAQAGGAHTHSAGFSLASPSPTNGGRPRDAFANPGDAVPGVLTPPPKAARRKLRVILLVIVLVLTAAAVAAIYFLNRPNSTLRGSLKFRELSHGDVLPEARKQFELKQRHELTSQAIVAAARRTMEVGVPIGFLGEDLENARKLDAALGSATWDSRDDALVLNVQSSDVEADRKSMLALLKAMAASYTRPPDAGLSEERDRRQAEMARLDNSIKDLTLKRQLSVDKSGKAPELRLEAVRLKQRVEEIKKQLLASSLVARGLEREVEKMESLAVQRPTTPGVPATQGTAVVRSEDDADLKQLLVQLKEMKDSLAAATDARDTQVGQAKASLEAAQKQFDAQVTLTRDAAAGDAAFAGYVEKLQTLQGELRRHNEELAQQQKDQRDLMESLKARLAQESTARIQRAWDADPQLKALMNRRGVLERRYNAALAGKLPESESVRVEMADVDRQVEALRGLIANKDEYDPVTQQFLEFIAKSVKQMEASRQKNEGQLAKLFAAFADAKPNMEKLPADQKARALKIDESYQLLSEARQSYEKNLAQANAKTDQLVRELSAQAAAQQARVDARKRQLIETGALMAVASTQPGHDALDNEEASRVAALADKREALSRAKDEEAKLQNQSIEAMVACRSVEGEADASTASAQSVADYDVRLGEMGSELLEAKKRLTEMLPDPLTHVEPAPVEDRSVEVLPVEDKRPLYAAGLMGAGMLFMLMSLAATRTPLAHDVPRMEPVHAYSAEELEPFAEAASTETFSMSPTGKRRRMNPAMASHTL